MCTGLSVFLITSFLYFIKPPPHAFQCYPLLLPPDKACIVSVMLVNMESVSVCLTFSNSLVLIRLRSSSVCPNLPNPRVCVYVKYTYNVNPVRPRWTRASRESVYVFLSIWPWSPAGRKKTPQTLSRSLCHWEKSEILTGKKVHCCCSWLKGGGNLTWMCVRGRRKSPDDFFCHMQRIKCCFLSKGAGNDQETRKDKGSEGKKICNILQGFEVRSP